MAWRLMLFPAEEVFVIEAGESECSGQHVEEVVVARQLDDDHEQDLNNENKKNRPTIFYSEERVQQTGR